MHFFSLALFTFNQPINVLLNVTTNQPHKSVNKLLEKNLGFRLIQEALDRNTFTTIAVDKSSQQRHFLRINVLLHSNQNGKSISIKARVAVHFPIDGYKVFRVMGLSYPYVKFNILLGNLNRINEQESTLAISWDANFMLTFKPVQYILACLIRGKKAASIVYIPKSLTSLPRQSALGCQRMAQFTAHLRDQKGGKLHRPYLAKETD